MKNTASTFKEAKQTAVKMSSLLKTPFSVVFDYHFDGNNDWRISVGKAKMAEFIAE